MCPVDMAFPDLPAFERKLQQRGFRRSDALFHDCPACDTRAVAIYVIQGRTGGRDIRLCHACGAARSWRSVAGLDSRAEDPAFDLRAFLGG